MDGHGGDERECDGFVAGVLPALAMTVPKTTVMSSKQPRYRLQNQLQPGAEASQLKMEFHIRTFQRTRRVVRVIVLVLASMVTAFAGPSLGLQTDIVSDQAEPGSFPLVAGKLAAPFFLNSADWPGVLRAGADLQADVERVTGIKPTLAANGAPGGKLAVIIGTVGKSPLIDSLVKAGKLNADAIAGRWESFIIATVANPLPGVATTAHSG
jgi:hypothetical protein